MGAAAFRYTHNQSGNVGSLKRRSHAVKVTILYASVNPSVFFKYAPACGVTTRASQRDMRLLLYYWLDESDEDN